MVSPGSKQMGEIFQEIASRIRKDRYAYIYIVGKYTNDLVYERLAPGILEELRRLNPKGEKGYRKSKHQQWLTEDIGHPELQKHLAVLIGFERASANWGMFYRMVQRALPKLNEQIPLALEE